VIPILAGLFCRRLKTRFLIFPLEMIGLSVLFVSGSAGARAAVHGQEREALGSLSSAGNVYVNGSLAPSESTVFSGDTVLTGDTGTATFSISGKGSLKISPQTHLAFANDPRYLAELTAGAVVMTSFAGATELSLKAGNFVVAPVIETEQSSSRIEKTGVGSFLIACLDGSVGVIPLQGTQGQVLRSGQTVEISSQGELGTPQETSTQPAAQKPVKKSNRTEWIILGAAGAGAAGIAAAVAGRGSHGQAVSPSSM
jgi:ferric-dicitrate binding protein FerR (iron transport regulator)